jgi:hypothetical protein
MENRNIQNGKRKKYVEQELSNLLTRTLNLEDEVKRSCFFK